MNPRSSRPVETGSAGDSIAVFRMTVTSFALGIVAFTAIALALILPRVLDGCVASRRTAAIEQIKEGLIPNELRTSTLVSVALAAPVVSVAVILLMRPSDSGLLERAKSAGRAM